MLIDEAQGSTQNLISSPFPMDHLEKRATIFQPINSPFHMKELLLFLLGIWKGFSIGCLRYLEAKREAILFRIYESPRKIC